MRTYWLFMIYVSPVLLVTVCGYLAWEAYMENQRADDDGVEGGAPDAESGEERSAGDDWRADPDGWREDGL